MNDDDEFDNLEDHYRRNRPPPDVAPHKGLDRETILALNDAVGTPLQIHEGGKMITDPDDGSPTGVATLRTSEVPMAPPDHHPRRPRRRRPDTRGGAQCPRRLTNHRWLNVPNPVPHYPPPTVRQKMNFLPR